MKKVLRAFVTIKALIVGLISLLASVEAFASIDYPGGIDDTFGNYPEHFTSTRLNGSGATLYSMAVQPDGKILIAGACTNAGTSPPNTQMCVGRVSASGLPDSSYATAGVFRLNESGVDTSYGAYLAPLADGSAYVAGTCGSYPTSHPCIVRLTSNGNKDTSFGTNGFVDYTPLVAEVRATLVRKSGKLVVLGQCVGGPAICIAQFSANGVYETGYRTTYGTVTTFSPSAIAEEANNRLVIAGSCFVTNTTRGCAVRYYTLDGLSGGIDPLRLPYVWDTPGESEGNGLAIQPDGAWLLSGNCAVGGVRRFCVRRMLANGVLDSTFGNAGNASLQFSALDNAARAIALQSDGKILLAGVCRTPNYADYIYCVARLQQNGRLDSSFGFNRDGRELIPLDQFAVSVSTATLQRDGQWVIGGGGGAMTLFRLRGGWYGARNCDFDVDADNIPGTSNDILLATRTSMGFTGSAVVQGATFASHASRTSGPAIRDYLGSQCGLTISP